MEVTGKVRSQATSSVVFDGFAFYLLALIMIGCAPTIGPPATFPATGLTKAYFACKPFSNKSLLIDEWKAKQSGDNTQYTYLFEKDGWLRISSNETEAVKCRFKWVSDKEIVIVPEYQEQSETESSVGSEGDVLSQESMNGRFIVLEQEDRDSLLLSWIGNCEWHSLGMTDEKQLRVTVNLTRNRP